MIEIAEGPDLGLAKFLEIKPIPFCGLLIRF